MTHSLLVAEGFQSPGPGDFDYPHLWGTFLTKPILIVIVCTVLVAVFFWAAARRAEVVPGKMQYLGEAAYRFVRNDIALEAIGEQGLKYVPYLGTLFFFLLTLNLSGVVPFLQFPATSHIALPLVLAIISWVTFNYVGIRRAGFFGYFKEMMFPPGLPIAIYVLLAPLEFLSTVIVRPITLTLRLTFNMFAGHLVLLLFILGGEYLLTQYGGAVGIGAGTVSLIASLVLTFFEGFVQILQAYVFVLLSALYIGGAIASEH